MDKSIAHHLKSISLVFVGLLILLIPYSLLLGWNLLTLFVFWFALVPAAAVKIPTLFSGRDHSLFESLVGLLLFYVFMVFMTYKLYDTGYFQVMLFGLFINLIVFFVLWKDRARTTAA